MIKVLLGIVDYLQNICQKCISLVKIGHTPLTNSEQAKVVEWFCLKPNWELFKILFLEKSIQEIIDNFSVVLFNLDKSEMGL